MRIFFLFLPENILTFYNPIIKPSRKVLILTPTILGKFYSWEDFREVIPNKKFFALCKLILDIKELAICFIINEPDDFIGNENLIHFKLTDKS